MALNRITGLGMVVLGSSMLLAVACDSGGTTASPSNVGGSTATNSTSAGGNTAAGGTSNASTTSAISGSTGGKTSSSVGGTSAASTSTAASCPSSITPPKDTGSISVTSGYVSAGTYAGYGFTWTGDDSIGDTCITPKCGTTGCTPSFGASSLCAAGVVAADPDYKSIIGVGFNLKQASSSPNPTESVTAGSSVTVGVKFTDDAANTGNAEARIQIVDAAGNNFCVASGAWSSGAPIDITSFNTACWDDSGDSLAAGTDIVSVHVIVPSDATVERPFSFCLTDFSM